jgi:hypothetical protein
LQCDARAGKRYFMPRFPLFLIATFVAYFGLIGLSVRTMLPVPPRSVEARQAAGSLIFDTNSLNAIVPAMGFPVSPAPGTRGDQTGPRLASDSALAPGALYSKGARLLLGPRTQAALKDGAVTVLITARGIPKSPSTKLAIGLVRGGPIAWVQAPVPADFGQIRLDIPMGGPDVTAIALWPSVEGAGKGIEVRTIVIQPPISQAPASQPQPTTPLDQ